MSVLILQEIPPAVWWLLLMAPALVLFLLFLLRTRKYAPEPPALRSLDESEQPDLVREVMNVERAEEAGGVRVFHGRLKESAARAYEKLKLAFSGRVVPMIREERANGAAILLVPKIAGQETMETPVRPWLHWLLFGLTVLTTTFAGAQQQGVNLIEEPQRFAVGLPFSAALLAILGCHELGHYFAARLHGVQVTPPFFVPVPFALGTFGAFIRMRSPTENRRQLFDIAVAGPLAGLVVAIPILYYGLQSSNVTPDLPPDIRQRVQFLHPSFLFVLIGKFALGEQLTSGAAVNLSPIAFAGWLGLFITALNLIPVGQLDGGHMTRAMFGARIGGTVSAIAMWAILLLAVLVWPGLLMWALIVFFLSGHVTPPLNDLTPVTPARRIIGYATFALLLSIVVPGRF